MIVGGVIVAAVGTAAAAAAAAAAGIGVVGAGAAGTAWYRQKKKAPEAGWPAPGRTGSSFVDSDPRQPVRTASE